MLHISTNEVFDGTPRDLYREWDRPNPMSVYARSKAAGEEIVRDLLAGASTSCASRGCSGRAATTSSPRSWPRAEGNGALRVAADEFGNPTYAPDLARSSPGWSRPVTIGIYHLTNAGFCSRFEFAREIMRLTGKPDLPVIADPQRRVAAAVPPPLHAILANTNGAALGFTLRPWQEALAEYVTVEGYGLERWNDANR